MNRSAREGKSVKRFERSNGPDIALYKNYLYLYKNIAYRVQKWLMTRPTNLVDSERPNEHG